MHSGLATQKNYIGLLVFISEQPDPVIHLLFCKHCGAMFFGIDVAMAAGKIAGRENMQENVSLAGFKTDGLRGIHGELAEWISL